MDLRFFYTLSIFLSLIYSSKAVSDVRLWEIFMSSLMAPSFWLPVQEKCSDFESWLKFLLGQVTSKSLEKDPLYACSSVGFDNHSNDELPKTSLVVWPGIKGWGEECGVGGQCSPPLLRPFSQGGARDQTQRAALCLPPGADCLQSFLFAFLNIFPKSCASKFWSTVL